MTEWQSLIQDNLEVFILTGWEGFLKKGRGVVVFHLAHMDRDGKGKVVGFPLEYLAENDPLVKERGGWPVENVPDVLSRYEPEKQLVVLVIEPTGAAHVTRLGNFPIEKTYRDALARQSVFGDRKRGSDQ